MDLIDRQAAIDAIVNTVSEIGLHDNSEVARYGATFRQHEIIDIIDELPSAQRWIPVSERLPEDLEEVNITFTNLEPEPYYDFIKGKRFTGSAVFYKGDWYWYSSITVDVLNEYGRYESEKIDEGLKIIAWTPLPEPYKE